MASVGRVVYRKVCQWSCWSIFLLYHWEKSQNIVKTVKVRSSFTLFTFIKKFLTLKDPPVIQERILYQNIYYDSSDSFSKFRRLLKIMTILTVYLNEASLTDFQNVYFFDSFLWFSTIMTIFLNFNDFDSFS